MWSDIQSKAVGDVFGALNAAGFTWAIIGDYSGLPEYNPSKDIDLIIDKHQMDKAIKLIFDVMKVNGFSYCNKNKFESMLCCEFYLISEGGTETIKIDVLYGFVWRGAVLVDTTDFLINAAVYNGLPVLNELLNGFLLWLKPLITGAGVKDKYRIQIMKAITDNPTGFFRLLEDKIGIQLAMEIWGVLEQGKLEDTIKFLPNVRRAGWITACKRNVIKTLSSTIEHGVRTIVLRLKRSPASMLAIVGPDGVGKTTFINLLKKELSRVLVKDEDAFRVQHFRPHLLPNIKQLLSGAEYRQVDEEFSCPHRAKPVGTISSCLRLSYYWLDYVAGYWMSIRRPCTRGAICIFDRYFYDFIVDPRRSRLDLPMWLRFFFLKLTPQPDLVFFLDCDADIVYGRKQELSRDEIARQLVAYRELAVAYPERFICLDASQLPEVSCQLAVRVLVERSFQVL